MINQEAVYGVKNPELKYRDRPGVYAVIESEGKIAVVKTEERVFLPGGGLEGGESFQACLIRECSEELGCDIEVGRYIGNATQYLLSFKGQEPLKITGHFYCATITGENNLQIEDDHELFWMSVDEAVDCMYVEFQAWAIRESIKIKFS
jgi:8-oxo-dGTP diphosphatase